MKYITWITYCILITLTACESYEDIPIRGKNIQLPVIEAFLLNDNKPQHVRVGFSVGLNDTLSGKYAQNAKVYLVGNADTLFFSYLTNGWFESDTFKAKLYVDYQLNVQIGDTVFTAHSTLYPLHGIDSLVYNYRADLPKTDRGYYVKMYAGNRESDSVYYYLVNVYKNRQLETAGSTMLLFKDEYFKSLNSLEYSSKFEKNDTVDVELFRISKQSFDYFEWLTNYLFGTSFINHSYLQNPPFQFTPNALGFFQVSCISRKSIVIK